MILLFACLFTSMTTFQTTFDGAQGLDYSVCHVTYMAAMIFSRFPLPDPDAAGDATTTPLGDT